MIGYFAANFNRILKEQGMTKNAFCEKTGMDQGNLAKYLDNGQDPAFTVVCMMAKGLGVGVEDLGKVPLDFELKDSNK